MRSCDASLRRTLASISFMALIFPSLARAEMGGMAPVWGLSMDGHLALWDPTERECFVRESLPRGLGGGLSVDLPFGWNRAVLSMEWSYHARLARWAPTSDQAYGDFSKVWRHRWDSSVGFRWYLTDSVPFGTSSIDEGPVVAPWLKVSSGHGVIWQPDEAFGFPPTLEVGLGYDLGGRDTYARLGGGFTSNLSIRSAGLHSDCFGECPACGRDYIIPMRGARGWLSLAVVTNGPRWRDILVPD